MIPPKNILIVRTDRIGDTVLTIPMAVEIKKSFPNTKVTFLVRNYTQELLKNHPQIDEVITLKEKDGKADFYTNLKIIKSKKFDSAILVYPRFILAMILKLAGIKNIIGTGYRWYSFLFNNKIFEHRKTADKHEIEFNIGLLKPFGIKKNITPATVIYNIQVDQQKLHEVEEILKAYGLNKDEKFVIIHPGSGGSAVDWPKSRFSEFINLMAQQLTIPILLTGSENEKKLCSEINISGNAKNLAGKFDLSQLIALYSLSGLVIANSTGPIHIAAAVETPVIGFYPKVKTCAPERWAPYSAKRIIHQPESGCSNCTMKQCAETNCMNTIKPENAIGSVKKLLKD